MAIFRQTHKIWSIPQRRNEAYPVDGRFPLASARRSCQRDHHGQGGGPGDEYVWIYII